MTRPTSVRASRSRSKHPPTHARVRCERRKVSAADLRCEVRSFPRVRHGENRLRVGRVLVESSFADNIADSPAIPAQVTGRCRREAPARLILRGERHPRSSALEIPSLRRSSCFSRSSWRAQLLLSVMNVIPHRLAVANACATEAPWTLLSLLLRITAPPAMLNLGAITMGTDMVYLRARTRMGFPSSSRANVALVL